MPMRSLAVSRDRLLCNVTINSPRSKHSLIGSAGKYMILVIACVRVLITHTHFPAAIDPMGTDIAVALAGGI